MADIIVKKEPDVIDNSEVKTIFPDISVVKTEIKQEIVTSGIEEEQGSFNENPSYSQPLIEIEIEELKSPKREIIDDIDQDYVYSTHHNDEQAVNVPGLVDRTPMAEVTDFTDSSGSSGLVKSEKWTEISIRESTPQKKTTIKRKIDIDEKNEKPLNNAHYIEISITDSSEPSTSMATDTVDITTDSQLTCDKCKIQFESKEILLQHTLECLPSTEDNAKALDMKSKGGKPYICVTCHKEFPKKYYLTRHMRIHTGEKPYTCNMCDYKTGHHCNLKNHMRTHTGEKPYACRYCDYRCSQKVGLNDHMKTHAGKKNFTCNICNGMFSIRGLGNHKKTHTKEKPYACNICDNKFSYQYHLTSHLKSHAGEKKYSCDRSIFYDWKMK